MTSSRRNLAVGAAAVVCALVIANMAGSHAQEPEGNFGVGIPSVFLPKYLNYRAQQLNSGTPDVMRVRLGYVKGLSTSFTKMVGEAAINLQSGAFNVSLNGLTPLQTYTVWLLDQTDIDAVPPLPDTVVGLVTFLATGPSRLLTGLLPLNLPLGFTIDRVAVVARHPAGYRTTGVRVGERLPEDILQTFESREREHRCDPVPGDDAGAGTRGSRTGPRRPDRYAASLDGRHYRVLAGLWASRIAPPRSSRRRASAESSGGSVKLDKLISKGAKLFFEETFDGNGRTCGTCHPASNNFTIDPAFIATLPNNDPLFVAEFNQALCGLERPALMRSDGLILENVDGLESPTTKFVMRGVPHTLGLQVSLERDTALVPAAPAEMTGWSGDGAPGTGSLREFAIGAVTQHFTKSLNRFVGQGLHAAQREPAGCHGSVSTVARSGGRLQPGEYHVHGRERQHRQRALYQRRRPRRTSPEPAISVIPTPAPTSSAPLSAPPGPEPQLQHQYRGQGSSFAQRHPDVRTRTFRSMAASGRHHRVRMRDGIFGNRTFNTASVVEAADTAPFFHNNVELTLKDAVAFYSGAEFLALPPAAAKFNFTDAQNGQIADFLRGVNTLQNIDVARRELQEILDNQNNPRTEQDKRLQTAFEETQDAIDVLTAPDADGIFASAVPHLNTAQQRISQAQLNTDPAQRRALVQQAIDSLVAARDQVGSGS